MSILFYKSIHILGIALLLVALGGLCGSLMAGVDPNTNRARKTIGITHGIALLLILISGFGMIAKLGTVEGYSPWGGWFWVKLLIWIFLGGVTVLLRRSLNLAKPFWFIIPLLVFLAAYMALYKPF